MKNLCGIDEDEIFNEIRKLGFSRVHSLKICNGIYKKGIRSVADLDIPKKLRIELASSSCIDIIPVNGSEASADGTIKFLFKNKENKKYETVFIPDKKRSTICVSSQSGCRMGCNFCATGKYGFHGNLSAGEIVGQVLSIPQYTSVNHVVFMGMGEPFDNFENVIKAAGIMTAQWGMSISSRNITVSTVGITPGVKRFLDETKFNLTVSLFSPFQAERMKIVPAERTYPVEDIIRIIKCAPPSHRRRLTLSYVMIQGLNDSDSHLEALKNLLEGTDIRINLLPYHPVGIDSNTSSSEERMHYFKHNLIVSGISASIRKSRGADISAACGLLASGLKAE